MADLMLRMKLLEKAGFSSLDTPARGLTGGGRMLTPGGIAEVAEGFARSSVSRCQTGMKFR